MKHIYIIFNGKHSRAISVHKKTGLKLFRAQQAQPGRSRCCVKVACCDLWFMSVDISTSKLILFGNVVHQNRKCKGYLPFGGASHVILTA